MTKRSDIYDCMSTSSGGANIESENSIKRNTKYIGNASRGNPQYIEKAVVSYYTLPRFIQLFPFVETSSSPLSTAMPRPTNRQEILSGLKDSIANGKIIIGAGAGKRPRNAAPFASRGGYLYLSVKGPVQLIASCVRYRINR